MIRPIRLYCETIILNSGNDTKSRLLKTQRQTTATGKEVDRLWLHSRKIASEVA